MGRSTKRFVGERKGHLEVLEVISQKVGDRHIQLRLLCHACGATTHQSSVVFSKSKSCGCERHKAGPGKVMGPKTMPWQLPKGEAARRLLVAQYKRSATSRNLPFELSDQEISTLFKGHCRYCGRHETSVCKGLGRTSGDYHYVGVDRVDPNLGYIKGNVVPYCWTCNMMKNTLTESDFLGHVSLIHSNTNKRMLNDD